MLFVLSVVFVYFFNWGLVHTETHLAVYVQILYRIGVSSRWTRCFGSLKPLYFETGTQSGLIWKRHPCVFVCTANPYMLWNDDVITPRVDPSQTPLSHVTATTADYILVFVLQNLLSLFISFVIIYLNGFLFLFYFFVSLNFLSYAMMLVCCLIKTFHIL